MQSLNEILWLYKANSKAIVSGNDAQSKTTPPLY